MLNENENLKEDDMKEVVEASLQVRDNSTALSSSKGDDFSSVESTVAQLKQMKELASVYINSNLCPIKKEEDFILAVITGNQLGIPYSVSINTIFPINGKPAMSVHLLRALLVKAGVIYEKTMDYVPIHQYFLTKEEDGKRVAKLDGGGKPILGGTAPYDKIDKELFMVNPKPSDYITEYTFTREIRQPSGKYKELTSISRFAITDAIKAELDQKDNWKKYPSQMCDARAFMKGAREIASDVVFGLYSIDELADANNVPYSMDESFTQTINVEAL